MINNLKIKDIYIDNNYNFSNHFELIDKPKWSKVIIKFLFPLFPIRLTTSVYLLLFFAVLLSLRIIIGFFAIPIVPFGFSISFGWMPNYIFGFFFGPVLGLMFGFISDTINNIIMGNIWFWLYAIQEPIIGMIAGCFGSIYFLNKVKRLLYQFITQKIIIYIFYFATILIIVLEFYVLKQKFSTKDLSNIDILSIVSICFISVFIVVNEIQSYYLYKKSKFLNNFNEFSLYLYLSILVILNTCLFSFILGPISFVEYISFLNGHPPSKYIEYGSMYYLVPRVLKESIKTPIYIIILCGIINAIKQPFSNIINLALNKW